MSDIFPIQNCLKQGDDPSPLLFNPALEYAIARFEQTRRRTKEFADCVNLLAESIHITNNNKLRFILFTCKESCLEVNAEKIKYMFMSSERNVGQNHNTNRSNKSFECVAQSKYSGFFWLKLVMQTYTN